MKTNFKIQLDWLEIAYYDNATFRNALNQINDIYRFENEEGFCYCTLERISPFGKYEHVFAIKVFHSEEESDVIIGKLYYGSYNRFCQDIYVRFENKVLYRKDLMAYRFGITDVFGLKFKGCRHIDLALDTDAPILNRFMRYYRAYEDYALIVNDEEVRNENDEVDAILHLKTGSRKKPYQNHSFQIVNSDSSLKTKCYDKQAELEKSEKNYIAESYSNWKRVFRIEISLSCQKQIMKIIDKWISEQYIKNRMSHDTELERYSNFLCSLGCSADDIDSIIKESNEREIHVRREEYAEKMMSLIDDERFLSKLFEEALYKSVHFRERRTRKILPLFPLLFQPITRKK